ncbi:MAG: T9SS type A sorting domain-containing protein [Chitinophagales bacterium]
MRKLISVVLLCCLNNFSLCQNRNNVWIIGAIPAVGDLDAKIDFSSGMPISDTLINATMPIPNTKANICDTAGNLLFYTNGIWIANRDDDTMMNGYGVTSGFGANYWSFTGTLILQGALILPVQDHPNDYYLFAVNADDSITFRPHKLVYSRVDMTLDGGLGGVTDKNISIVDSVTLTNGRITACKHADGKSWWLIAHESNNSKYLKWLVTADSIYGPYFQTIGSDYGTGFTDVTGQSAFSNDGSLFATFGNNFKLDIMDFDRCTGIFSNCNTITFNYNYLSVGIPKGCLFSPNDRFIYANTDGRMWQVDLQSDTGLYEIDTVGYYDSTSDPFPAYFANSALGPDGKIYIGEWNGNIHLHVINAPNQKGAACHFQQHSYKLPVYNGTVPNFVNYDLGPLKIFEADAGTNKYISNGDTVQLGTPPIDSLIYQWSASASLSNINTAQPLSFPDTTTKYYLTIIDTTDTAGCNQRIDSIMVYVDEYPLGNNFGNDHNGIIIFPNPVSKMLTVSFGTIQPGAVLSIFNDLGIKVKEQKIFSKPATTINVSALLPGIYFLRIQSSGRNLSQKFIKE